MLQEGVFVRDNWVFGCLRGFDVVWIGFYKGGFG